MKTAKLESIDCGKKSFHSKDLMPILAKNSKQRYAMEEFFQGQNMLLVGSAGVGKTFLALYMAIKEVLDRDTNFERVVIVRSAVPVRDIGFLPGTEEEKTEIYEAPYRAICDELFEYRKSYDNLKKSGKIQFITTSYIRGINIRNAVVIVDECQSLTAHELDSVITRLSSGSRLILCGDSIQTDLQREKDRRGFHEFISILEHLTEFSRVEFTHEDIVRSGLVRNYIVARDRLGLQC